MGQGFSKHMVILLDQDDTSKANAERTRDKSALKDKQVQLVKLGHWKNAHAQDAEVKKAVMSAATIANFGFDAESKITLVGHGEETSSEFTHNALTPFSVATLLRVVTRGVKIKRVSLLCCYGGGRVSPKPMYRMPVQVQPENSYGFELASYMGQVALTLTARTEGVKVNVYLDEQGKPTRYATGVGGGDFGTGEHHGQKRKVVFKINPSSTTVAPINPTWEWETYEGYKK